MNKITTLIISSEVGLRTVISGTDDEDAIVIKLLILLFNKKEFADRSITKINISRNKNFPNFIFTL